jgi:hypothetical protein
MTPTKTLPEREKELQALLASAAGKAELQELAARYSARCGRVKPLKASIITYILVYERGCGLICR